MKLEKLKINSYGKIKNKEIDLKDGINIIKGNNESGKSTILSYISSMFYGASSNLEKKKISDYDKFKPWEGDEFSGKIKYKLDNGEEYEVFRDFKKKNQTKIYNKNLEEITDKFGTDKSLGSTYFVEQTGVDKSLYQTTILSTQENIRLDQETQNSFVQRLSNILSSGEDSTSYKKVSDNLNNKIKNEIGSSRSKDKPINVIGREIETLKKQILELNQYEVNKFSINGKKEKILEDLDDINNKNNFINEIYDIKNDIEKNTEKVNELEEKISNIEKNKKENDEQKIQIKEKIEKIEKNENATASSKKNNQKINKNNKNLLIIKSIIFILFIICLICSFAIPNIIVKNICGIFSILLLFLDTYLFFKFKDIKNDEEIENENNDVENDDKIKEYNNKLGVLDGKEQAYLDDINKNNEDIKKLDAMLDELSKKEDSIINKYSNKLDEEFIERIKNSKNIDREKRSIQDEKNTLELELKKTSVDEENVAPMLEKKVQYEEKLDLLKEQYDELIKREEVIRLALESLDESYEEMKNNIIPKFTNNLSNNINKFTDGKYNRVTINDKEGLIVEKENGEYASIHNLSSGTVDQLYLALRLSMINDMTSEKMPILLDESFCFFDDERLENVLKFIYEELNSNQLIVFTCTKREEEILNKNKIKYNLINL